MSKKCYKDCHQAFVGDKNVETCSPLCDGIGKYTASLTDGTLDTVGNAGATWFGWVDQSVRIAFYKVCHKAFVSGEHSQKCKVLSSELGKYAPKVEEDAGVGPFFGID